MRKFVNLEIWCSRVGLGLIFSYCFLASVFFSSFAERHLTFKFLSFPVFIGEIVLLVCLLLLARVCWRGMAFSSVTALVLGLYFGWVGVKALVNFANDGPLAFRNAALFYYPIFAVFSYCFYQKSMIPRQVLMSFAVLAGGFLLFKGMVVWYWWTYFILCAIAVWNMRSIPWRWAGRVFLAMILVFGSEYLYKGPRAHFVSIFCSVIFLAFFFGALWAKRRLYIRLGILVTGAVLFVSGFFVLSNREALSSVISFQRNWAFFQQWDRDCQEQGRGFVPESFGQRLYHPNSPSQPEVSLSSATIPETPAMSPVSSVPSVPSVSSMSSVSPVSATPAPNTYEAPVLTERTTAARANIFRSKIRDGREPGVDENNIVFRLFIWRDMAQELIQKRAFFGFSFGWPQRSRSLEIFGWAREEWARDGWITPHNSFFHVIYRSGILGFVLIGVLFFMLGRLACGFFILNSREGGFLISVLVYWLVLSNFFVILELPYNAIVFWTLLGITCAHGDRLRRSQSLEENRL